MYGKFSVLFIKRYGCRDGLVLSVICSQTIEGYLKTSGFTKHEAGRLLDYISENQLRRALEGLEKHGCLVKKGIGGMNRSCAYRIDEKYLDEYMAGYMQRSG